MYVALFVQNCRLGVFRFCSALEWVSVDVPLLRLYFDAHCEHRLHRFRLHAKHCTYLLSLAGSSCFNSRHGFDMIARHNRTMAAISGRAFYYGIFSAEINTQKRKTSKRQYIAF